MRLLLVAGSPRRDSRTRVLVEHAHAYARDRQRWLDVDLLDLHHEPLDPFRGFGEPYSEATRAAVDRVIRADALILGSPVFNGGIASALKSLFEHVDYKALEGRVAGFILVGGGERSFLQARTHLAQLMTYFNVHVVPRAVFSPAEDVEGPLPRRLTRRIERLVDAVLAEAEAHEATRVTLAAEA